MGPEKRIPYPGLRAFQSDESDLFFGRDGCVDQMLTILGDGRFLSVLGTSGSGKSSLVRTGLVDALELGFLPNAGTQWVIADMHPGGRPFRNLARALSPRDADDNIGFEAFLSRGPRSVVQWCDDGNLTQGQCLLLLVDQFEELFRYQDYAGREQAEAFVALLLECIASDAPIYVVITMRSEYLGACALMPGLAEQINRSLFLTRRMTRDECREAIEGPSKVLGFEIEPKLVNRILNDLASFAPWESEGSTDSIAQLARRADQLPLMQHVLNRSWRMAAETSAQRLLHDDYEALGGLGGAIDAHAAEVSQQLSPSDQRVIPAVFRALVHGTRIADAVRNPQKLSSLKGLSDDPDAVTRVIEAFRSEDCNFLRPGPEQSLEDDTIIDLGHESLIRQWSDMEHWLAEEARATTVWRRLVSSADAHKDGKGELLAGLDLANIRDWYDSTPPRPDWAAMKGGDFGRATAYLEKSIAAEDARIASEAAKEAEAKKALRFRAAIYLTAAIISVGTALFAFSAMNTARSDRAIAEAALERAAQSEALVIRSADEFLVDLADRLKSSIGVPKKDIEELFANADAFIDDLKGSAKDASEIYRIEARLALQKSEYERDRNETEIALNEARRAIRLITTDKPEANYSKDDLEVLLGAKVQEAWSHDDREISRDIATDITNILDKNADQLTAEESNYWRARALGILSFVASTEERREDSRLHAQTCLLRLDGLNSDAVNRQKIYCHLRVLWSYQDAPEDVVYAADRSLDLIPPENRTRGDWNRWFYIKNSVGSYLHDSGRFDDTIKLFEKSIDRAGDLAALESDEYDWHWHLARSVGNAGVGHWRKKERDTAYRSVLRAIEILADFEHTHKDNPARAESLQSWVNRAQTYGEAVMIRTTDAALPRELATLAMRESELLTFLVENGEKDDCEACAIPPVARALGFLREAINREDLNAADDFFASYDRLLELTEPYLDEEDFSRAAIIARENLFVWQGINLTLPPHRGDPEQIDAQLDIVSRAEERVKAARDKFPRLHALRVRASSFAAEKARLLFAAGRPDEAISALDDARDPLQAPVAMLEAEWYRFGNGPYERNAELADRLDAVAENLPHLGFSIPVRVDPLSTEEKDERTFYIGIWGSAENDSVLDDIVWVARFFRGAQLTEATLARLQEEEEKARQSGVTFGRHMAALTYGQQFAQFGNIERSVSAIRSALRNSESEDAMEETADIITGYFLNPGYERSAITILNRLLSETDHPLHSESVRATTRILGGYAAARADTSQRSELVQSLQRNADRLMQAEIIPKLLTLTPEQIAEYYLWEGVALIATADPKLAEQGEQSLATAAILDPESPLILSALGEHWSDDDVLYPHAHRLMLAAREGYAPEDEFYSGMLATLALTTARTGDPETGLALIDEAIAAENGETSARNELNRAQILHQLGRTEDAIKAFDLARALSPQEFQQEKIDRLHDLLEPFRAHDDATRAAVVRMVGALKGTNLSPRQASVDDMGIAILGYDAVAYHTEGEAKLGSPKHFSRWNEGIWLFSSAENKTEFEKSPNTYAPTFGGYDGTNFNDIADNRSFGSPEIWALKDGQLFFFSSYDNKELFEEMPAAQMQARLLQWQRAAKQGDYSGAPFSPYSKLIESMRGEE